MDRVAVNSNAQGAERTNTTPVTQQLEYVAIRSAGADGWTGTGDDFNVADFSRAATEQSARDKQPQAARDATIYSGNAGAISGMLTDPSGAVVPGTTVTATHQYLTDSVFETTSDDEGRYLLRNLPAGLYTVRVNANGGFAQAVVMEVSVESSTMTTVNFSLTVGAVQETVTVIDDSVSIDSTNSKLQTTITSQSTEMLPKGTNFSSLLQLSPGARNEALAGGFQIDGASGSENSLIIDGQEVKNFRSGVLNGKNALSTPRLRKDFPETLYWQPSVETDRGGRTALKFKLADNITTWKLSIIGSTESGEIGTVEQDIRAFQPFFVEHDPPRVLTEGDEISLPVVLRNYLARPQPVALDIKLEEWFTLLSPAHKQANVAAGDASRETFDFRAVASVKAGSQRITAIGADASDRIEKPVEVHPDGEETAATTTQILRAATTLETNVPAYVIPHTAHAELKLYPNLSAHAIESVEAILARPYGCAEQTISSTYPSLLVLRHYAGVKVEGERPPITVKALRYVREGYDRLLSYRDGSGGFSYWGRGEPDLALTAYAFRFLSDARAFIEVDDAVLRGARDWLIRQQRPDGSWSHDPTPAAAATQITDSRGNAMLTAYVARILAMQQKRSAVAPDTDARPNADAKPSPLQRALAYLAPRTLESDEPYLIASYALAAIDAGESPDKVAVAIERLRQLAHDEAGGAYWTLETNTPFYGWGRAGRIETTALVVQALTRAQSSGATEIKVNSATGTNAASESAAQVGSAVETTVEKVKGTAGELKVGGVNDAASELKADGAANSHAPARQTPQRTDALLSVAELQNRGLLFLLKNKDRYGVWLSTQATVNVLDALAALAPAAAVPEASSTGNDSAGAPSPTDARTAAAQQAEVFVNGQSAGTVALPAANELANPVTLDLSRWLVVGDNRIEIRRANGTVLETAAAQVVTTYYVPWENSTADGTHAKARDARALRLNVSFDRTSADVGATVACRVEAERIGHQGYGMLLAEVGLPPGADVDRASLERAMKESRWEFSHYDVLPDRLVVYLWPRAGGTNFTFNFRPRFGLNAKSASSVVYDYYNPEARAVLAPTKFAFVDKGQPAAPAQAKLE